MAYNQAYGTNGRSAHEMSRLGTSSLMIINENALSNTLQGDFHHEYERIRHNSDLLPPSAQPEDQASSGIYETIPTDVDHPDNSNDGVDYLHIIL